MAKNHKQTDTFRGWENAYSFDLIAFNPIDKHIRAIFLNRTQKPINAVFTLECHITFILYPLQCCNIIKRELLT